MDCPNCSTWNPDDKLVCWRCQTVLPKPVEVKKKRQPAAFLGLPSWIWLMVVAMMALLIGRRVAGQLNTRHLQQAFAWICVLVALLMLASALGWLAR